MAHKTIFFRGWKVEAMKMPLWLLSGIICISGFALVSNSMGVGEAARLVAAEGKVETMPDVDVKITPKGGLK